MGMHCIPAPGTTSGLGKTSQADTAQQGTRLQTMLEVPAVRLDSHVQLLWVPDQIVLRERTQQFKMGGLLHRAHISSETARVPGRCACHRPYKVCRTTQVTCSVVQSDITTPLITKSRTATTKQR